MMEQKLGPRQQKWIDTLRSGDYVQGKAYLNRNDVEFCCLGVACEIFKDELNLVKETREDKISGETVFSYNTRGNILPVEVADHLKLFSCGGDHKNSGKLMLSYLNDGGYSFNQIADVIINEPEAYFSEEV